VPDSNSVAIHSYLGADVRMIVDGGSVWFVAADVARVLGYSEAAAMTRSLDDDEKGLRIVQTPGGAQQLTVVSEGGVYASVLRSRIPTAKQFRRWVTDTVLPQIRHTGNYIAHAAVPALPQTFAEALREFAAEVEAHETTKAELAEAAPRAEAWDAFASATGDYSVGDAAKILARAGISTGPQRLFNQLAELKWTFRGEGGKWRAYAERVDKGYLSERPQFHYHPETGERVIDPPQLRVTVRGLQRLRTRLHTGPSEILRAVSA
jgi:anti-repressor protein